MHKIDVHKLADESRFNRFHGLVLFWGVLILVLDGYDLAVVGAALPAIMKDMGVEATQAGFMASSALFGMMFGAIFLGTLADRIGRPLMISVCVALFSLFTAAAGLMADPVTFSVTRFLAGLGIGGVLPIVTAQMAEFAPVKLRARLVTLVFAGYSVGGILVALTGKQLIETYGWQSVFYVAALPVLLIPFIMKTMPNSMPFLIKRNRDAELRGIVRKLVPNYPLQEHEQFVVPAEDRATSAPVAKLFHDGRGFSTVMIWIAFFMGLFMVYALSSWLTKLMAMAGYSLGSALNFTLVFNVGAMIGAVLGGWLGDKYNIKYVLVAFYAVGAVSLTVMGYTKSTELLFLMVFIVGASTLGTQLLAYAYAGEFYPTAIRSTGVGFASGIGRAGAILAPVLIGFLVSLKLPLEQNFMAIGLAGLLGTIAVMLINHGLCASTHHYDAAREAGEAESRATAATARGAAAGG
jgi:MFS transporter, AAHS family, benzoate transport protein